MKKSEKGGTRPAHRASVKYGILVIVLSMEEWDAGQAVVLPHSLKIVARAELTLPKPSAGAANGGGPGRDTGFFPLPFFVEAMAMGRGGEFEIGLKTEAGVRAEEGQRALERQKGERLCTTTSPPSIAQNQEVVGEQCRPRPINRHAAPKVVGC